MRTFRSSLFHKPSHLCHPARCDGRACRREYGSCLHRPSPGDTEIGWSRRVPEQQVQWAHPSMLGPGLRRPMVPAVLVVRQHIRLPQVTTGADVGPRTVRWSQLGRAGSRGPRSSSARNERRCVAQVASFDVGRVPRSELQGYTYQVAGHQQHRWRLCRHSTRRRRSWSKWYNGPSRGRPTAAAQWRAERPRLRHRVRMASTFAGMARPAIRQGCRRVLSDR